MTFRTRVLLACLVAAVIPLAIIGAGARNAVRERLTQQYRERVALSADAARTGLSSESAAIAERLESLVRQVSDDAQLRAALVDSSRRSSLIDFAPDAMTASGLDYLVLLTGDGVVLSSGHFRNAFGRPLSLQMHDTAGAAVIEARRAAGSFLALARSRTFSLGRRNFTFVGGIELDSMFVTRLAGASPEGLAVQLEVPGGVLGDAGAGVTERVVFPFIRPDDIAPDGAEAVFTLTHSLAPLDAVLRAMDRWFAAALTAAVLLAFVIAHVLASRVNSPLEQLAALALRIELDSHDMQFAMQRQDEVGALSRLLDRMVYRLRAGAHQLRNAERRATVGDMARQVNHDIRNGLLPIRNVIRHLGEVARESPAELGSVFDERRDTLEGSIGYLENLATNYARLSPQSERRACDVNAIVQGVTPAGNDRVTIDLDSAIPRVVCDPVALRRIIENLALNALESLPIGDGAVTIRTAASNGRVVLTVDDTGAGIPPDQLDRIFDDFYTTKPRGTGLGLSIVRRLVADMGGRISVRSASGRGTTFTVELPAASTPRAPVHAHGIE